MPYPDRSYIFDLGALLIYTSLYPEIWGKYVNRVIEKILTLQNSDGMWARSYCDSGIAEKGFFTGPASVLARGLLTWEIVKNYENSKVLNASLKTADYLLKDFNKIKVSDYYVIKQETGIQTSSASPEENARAAIFFIDLYKFLIKKNQKKLAVTYLNAAENVLLGICCKRKEIYPFGFFDNGEANWNMPDREGVEGQAVMLRLYIHILLQVKTIAHPEWNYFWKKISLEKMKY